MEQYDSRVDAYIGQTAEFARPILTQLRQLVHQASADLKETMKWGCPFFDHDGPVCQMAAFKQHCAFGFWKAALMDDPHQILNQQEGTAGSLGKLSSINDLPADEILIQYIRQALILNSADTKVAVPKKTKPQRGELIIPLYFTETLDLRPSVKEKFFKLSPSHQREYIAWMEEAKTEATRIKRLNTAIEWISEGKSRNWKYQ